MPCQVDVPAADGVGTVFLHVACGSNHCLSVDNKGTLFAWGCGSYGKLGHGDAEARFVPTRVAALEGASASICCFACLLPIHPHVLLTTIVQEFLLHLLRVVRTTLQRSQMEV